MKSPMLFESDTIENKSIFIAGSGLRDTQSEVALISKGIAGRKDAIRVEINVYSLMIITQT